MDDLRSQIDALDEEMAALLARRARLAQRIGELKGQQGSATFAPARESEILRRIRDLPTAPLPPEAVASIFTEIVSACRALEQPLVAAYLGPAYTFTHMAALRRFGSHTRLVPTANVYEAFAAVSKHETDIALVPVENSIRGVEAPTLDALAETDLRVCGEFYLPIHYCLAANCDLDEVTTVFSHPLALAQCGAWLRRNLPRAELVETYSTAHGAARAAGTPGAAGLCPHLAAEAHGLAILAENLADLPHNRTRFLIIGRDSCPPTGRDKTSIVMATKHEAGALYRALAPFDDNGINMTLIESRPTRQTPWQYHFFIDFQGHEADDSVSRALASLRERCLFVKVLGSYPEADLH
ncbi:MAG: prephenate dehydratase [Armatimonadota bacterium]